MMVIGNLPATQPMRLYALLWAYLPAWPTCNPWEPCGACKLKALRLESLYGRSVGD
jgi:hypothetical protein